jgi:hypothetical protein
MGYSGPEHGPKVRGGGAHRLCHERAPLQPNNFGCAKFAVHSSTGPVTIAPKAHPLKAFLKRAGSVLKIQGHHDGMDNTDAIRPSDRGLGFFIRAIRAIRGLI